MRLRAKRLKGLAVDDISAVDHPAHLAEGWIVQKSAGEGDALDAEIEASLAQIEDQEEPVDLLDALRKGRASLDGAAAAQADALIAALSGATGDDPIAKAAAATEAAETARKAAEDRASKAEAALKALAGGEAPDEPDELAKAVGELPAPLRKAWADTQVRLENAEKVAKAERDARLGREYVEKARAFPGLVVKAESLGPILRAVDEGEALTKEQGAELDRVLRAASNLAHDSKAFERIGGVGQDATDAWAGIEKAADEILLREPTLDRPTAVTKAMDANPELARRYTQEVS